MAAEHRDGDFGRAGLGAATRFVAAAVSEDAAAVFAAFAAIRSKEGRGASLDIDRVVPVLGGNAASALSRLQNADRAFHAAFSHPLLSTASTGRGPAAADAPWRARMSRDILGLLEVPPARAATPSAIFDEAGMNWISLVHAASRAERGHHLVLRSVAAGDRTATDPASLVAACGAEVFVLKRAEHLPWEMLRTELHGGGRAVVVADGDFLLVARDVDEEDEFVHAGVHPDRGVLMLAGPAAGLVPWLQACSNTYVWRIPGHGRLPAEVAGRIGGCIGPLGYDAAWSAAYLKARAKGIGPAGTQALLGAATDVRDAEAIARLAAAIATAAVPDAPTTDEACRFLAASFNGAAREPAADADGASPFDERLVACEADGLALLGRGDALSHGGRVLAVGPPGGGKSSYARALGARISAASGPAGSGILALEPADLLAKSWGATERTLAALWARAERERATIVADELDSLCAVREADAPASGNAYLIRSLTNEFLRQLDAHPRVPVIATVNDLKAVDPAVRRRFTIVVEMRDELEAGQERLAWDVILEMAPPAGWSPCGAAVADYAVAAKRCRLLGKDDAESHAAAITEARRTRLGSPSAAASRKPSGALH